MDHLPTDCDVVIFQYLLLDDLLSVRACSSSLRKRHDPRASRRIWLLVAPTARALVAHLPAMSLTSVQLVSIVYEFSADEVRHQRMLSTMCGRDCLVTPQWLASHFSLTADAPALRTTRRCVAPAPLATWRPLSGSWTTLASRQRMPVLEATGHCATLASTATCRQSSGSLHTSNSRGPTPSTAWALR